MLELSIEELRTYVDDSSTERDGANFCNDVEIPFQISSKDFLKYAEYDLNTKYEHHIINALSNIKRAIDCQIDSLLFAFGLLKKARKNRWSFPDKVEALTKLGLVSPRILTKINKQRNFLEHEFEIPNKDAVEDALDVAILFEAYTEKFLHSCIEGFGFSNEKLGGLEITMNYKEHIINFRLRIIQPQTGELQKVDRTISSDDDLYFEYLKFFIGLYEIL